MRTTPQLTSPPTSHGVRRQACYCNGGKSDWSAQRVLEAVGARGGSAALVADPVRAAREGAPVPLTAEMVFPFLFDDYAALRPFKARSTPRPPPPQCSGVGRSLNLSQRHWRVERESCGSFLIISRLGRRRRRSFWRRGSGARFTTPRRSRRTRSRSPAPRTSRICAPTEPTPLPRSPRAAHWHRGPGVPASCAAAALLLNASRRHSLTRRRRRRSYVDFDLSKRTGDGIVGARVWVTNEFLHSGVREDGPRVFKTLLGMARDEDPIR